MKKITYLLSFFLLLALGACSEIIVEPDESSLAFVRDANSPIPETICLTLGTESVSRVAIGEKDNFTGQYPLSLEEGDKIYIYGISGDTIEAAEEYVPHVYVPAITNRTMELMYAVTKTAGGKSSLVLQSENYLGSTSPEAYASTSAFVILSDRMSDFCIGNRVSNVYDCLEPGKIVKDALLYANKLDKAAFERLCAKWGAALSPEDVPSDDCLPVYVLSSLIKVHMDATAISQDLELDQIGAWDSVSNDPLQGAPDLARFDDMIANRTFYATGLMYSAWMFDRYVLKAGECADFYFGVAPGTFQGIGIEFSYSSGYFGSTISRVSNGRVSFNPGTVYEISFILTQSALDNDDYYDLSSKIHIGNQSFNCKEGDESYTDLDRFTNIVGMEGLLRAGVGIVPVPGYGNQSDFDDSVKDKIALVKRGSINFSDKVINAFNAGAVGVIVYNTSPSVSAMSLSDVDKEHWIPAVIVEQGFYDALVANPTAKVSINEPGLLFPEDKRINSINLSGETYYYTGNKCVGYSAGESETIIARMLESMPVELVPFNDFTGLDLTGKVALLEFVPSDHWSSFAQSAKAVGASAVLYPGCVVDSSKYVYLPDIDCDIPCATIEGSFPAHYKWCMAQMYQAVDLGLSVMWATVNVGAEYPEAWGDYYGWGETSADKSFYAWMTYSLCTRVDSSYPLYKYCTYAEDGTVDNKTVLEPMDDVAHMLWGGKWRMPTDQEWQELIQYCTWTWTSTEGGYGFEVESTIPGYTGNSIFLPAAGYYSGFDVMESDNFGYYWSSSLGNTHSFEAKCLSVGHEQPARIEPCNRYDGLSVRPVRP